MKFKIIHLLLLLTTTSFYGQFGPQQIISTNADLAIRAIPIDMDADGFMDILSASYLDGKVAWYRNTDGEGNFSEEIIITTALPSIERLLLADLDGDGDQDLVYTTNLGQRIAWMEHLDGLGSFGTENLISSGLYPYDIAIGDIDNDGDLDLVAELFGAVPANFLVWFENTDGEGAFLYHDINEFPQISGEMKLTDIDNDSDLDIITSFIYSGGGESLIWYENISEGNFNEPIELYAFDFLVSEYTLIKLIHPADVNNDGKIDLIFETHLEGLPARLSWAENLGGAGNFEAPILIANVGMWLNSIQSYDLDLDGDLDILATIYLPGTYVWFENLDGLGNFGPQQTIYDADANAAFIDSDEWPDIVSSSPFDDTIAWYKNLGELGLEELDHPSITIYPNPTDGIITISSEEIISDIRVYNLLGQQFSAILNGNQLNLESLPAGVYYLAIQMESGNKQVQKIVLH